MTGVLVVDDSSFARLSIMKQLSKDPDIKILDYAKDGIEAVQKVKELKPDVVTLDVQMPRMNGLEALEQIMSNTPTPVVMLSSLTDEGTDTTIRALEIGAIDFYPKSGSLTSPLGQFGTDGGLVQKIKLAAIAGRQQIGKRIAEGRIYRKNPVKKPVRALSALSKIVVIGCSTGGPGALHEVIPNIPDDIPAGILIVQHMPAAFTKSLAVRLNEISQIRVKEAEQGDIIFEGQAYLAPGNFHMTIEKGNRIGINQSPPIMGLRPCVNVTMESVAVKYRNFTIGVILTGMGNDGTEGVTLIRKLGGKSAVQDEDTSVIYGMPKSVIEAGQADKIVPLQEMAQTIVSMCTY